jgi:hypothetical protein
MAYIRRRADAVAPTPPRCRLLSPNPINPRIFIPHKSVRYYPAIHWRAFSRTSSSRGLPLTQRFLAGGKPPFSLRQQW